MRRRAFVALTLPMVLLAGCSPVASVSKTYGQLRDAGYDVAKVGVTASDGGRLLEILWEPDARTTDELARERQDVAKFVWESADGRFDRLLLRTIRMTIPGHGRTERTMLTRADLEASFGPRDPALDSDAYEQGVDRRGLVSISAGALLLLGAVWLLAWANARRRQRNAAWAAEQRVTRPG